MAHIVVTIMDFIVRAIQHANAKIILILTHKPMFVVILFYLF